MQFSPFSVSPALHLHKSIHKNRGQSLLQVYIVLTSFFSLLIKKNILNKITYAGDKISFYSHMQNPTSIPMAYMVRQI